MLRQNLDLTKKQLNRLKKNKATIIKPTQLSDKGYTIELPKKHHKRMMKNFNMGKGFKIGGEVGEKDNNLWKIISNLNEDGKAEEQISKNTDMRKKFSIDLSTIINKALNKSDCAKRLLSIVVASDLVEKLGTKYGFGAFSKLKVFVIKPIVKEILSQVLTELSDDRIQIYKCIAELTLPISKVVVDVYERYNDPSNTFTKAKYLWKYLTKKEGEKMSEMRKVLISEISSTLYKLMLESECFQLIISIAVARDIVDKIGDYTGGFGIVEDIQKKLLTEFIQPVILSIFNGLVKIAEVDINEETIKVCADELTKVIVDLIVDELKGRIEKLPEFLKEQQQKFRDLLQTLKRKPGLLPPSSRKVLSKIGDTEITDIQVFYYPIENETFINYATMGSFEEAKKEMGYDNMLHLGLLFNKNILYHKTDVVVLREEKPSRSDAKYINVSMNEPILLGAFIDNQLKYMGDDDFSNYTASTLNCQDFVKRGLEANDISIAPIKDILQDVYGVFKLMPDWVENVADVATDVASVINKQVEGEGTKNKNKKC
jgi:hypothetical protein